MAKQTEKDITPGTISGKDAVDYVQAEQSQEAQNERGAKQRQADAEIEALAKNMGGKDVLARLDKTMTAKPEAFEAKSKDFIRLSPGQEVRGIYLGTVQGPKYKVHAIGTLDPKTKEPMVVRLNGTTILTKELMRGEKGQGVYIKCNAVSKTAGGNNLFETEVRWL